MVFGFRSVQAVVLLVLLAGLAGCLGDGPAPANASDGDDRSLPGNGHPSRADRPHVHDRWEGKNRTVVVDRTVRTDNLTDPRSDPVGGSPSCEFPCGDRITVVPHTGRIVPPGTAEVRLIATWDAQDLFVERTEVSLEYIPANGSGFVEANTRPSGEPWRINTSVAMADDGHAKQSLWVFRLTVSSYVDAPETRPQVPGLLTESIEIDLRVVAHRTDGELPREPPHPDYWGDGPRRTLITQNGTEDAAGVALIQATGGHSTTGTAVGWDAGPEVAMTGDEHGIVPPGTNLLMMNVTWTNDSPAADQAPARPYAEVSNRGPYVDQERWAPDRVGDGEATFTMPIDQDDWDGMYANRSRWFFHLVFKGERIGDGIGTPEGDLTGAYHFQGSWRIEIAVFNGTEAG